MPLSGRPPFIEERQNVFGCHGAGGFEFTALLTEEEVAIGIENSDSGDTSIEGNIIFFRDVEVFVHAADVDVNDEEGFVERGRNFGRVEGFVEDMAIKAPVAAEDHENSLAGLRGGVNGLRDLSVSVDSLGIDRFVFERLAETRGRGSASDPEVPIIALEEPVLGHGDKLLFGGTRLLRGQRELKDDGVNLRRGLTLLNDLGGEAD